MIAIRDAAHVIGSYAVTFAGIALYTLVILRRARNAPRQVPPEDFPWT